MESFLGKVLGTLGAKEPRELWVDDSKCKACYECETPFGLIVRRHHCRICGRIFCANCTGNSVPPQRDSPDQQWQRVCNYCEWLAAPAPRSCARAAAPERRRGLNACLDATCVRCAPTRPRARKVGTTRFSSSIIHQPSWSISTEPAWLVLYRPLMAPKDTVSRDYHSVLYS